jgi:CPA2 family monovalent cation:H+ antiporter-2
MHLTSFLQDLAVIMIVAGIVTIVFHRLKQPVVLGYIIAGMILGPNTPPFTLIHDMSTVRTLAELGVIFLMFSLGLEFSVQKLFRIGTAALVAAIAEIFFMVFLGYEIGQYFGWKWLDSLFLGAMLAISSTTIIIKALNELGMKKESFAQTIFGILIIEDILAIAILALLSSLAIGGTINTSDVFMTLGKLLVFLVTSLVVGVMIVPKLLTYVARFKSNEMLLITVLGICFGFSLLVIRLGYSVALGAFLIGAIMAEASELKLIEKIITPLTNMFSAIFFVSIGLLVEPKILITYIVPISLITLAIVFGKTFICSAAVFLAGRDGKTSIRIGMGLAQIGEFSFIIASLGITLNVTSSFLYPIIVAVSAITTFLTPYLIKLADPLSSYLATHLPKRISQALHTYTRWVKNIRSEDRQALIAGSIKKGLFQIAINLILIIAIFIIGSFLADFIENYAVLVTNVKIQKAFVWGTSLIISLPFLIAIYRKLKGLSMILAELAIKLDEINNANVNIRRIIAELIPAAFMLGVILMIIALSANILPPTGLLIFVLAIVIAFTVVLWRWFIKLHSYWQIVFMERFKKKDKDL